MPDVLPEEPQRRIRPATCRSRWGIFADMEEAIEAFKEHTDGLEMISEATVTRMMVVSCLEEPINAMPT